MSGLIETKLVRGNEVDRNAKPTGADADSGTGAGTGTDRNDNTPRVGRIGRVGRVGVIALLSAAMLAFAVAPLALPESYSTVKLSISEAGAQGLDGAWVARTGFIIFGLAVIWLVELRPEHWTLAATACHLAFGVSMFAVAAFSHKPWDEGAAFVKSEESLHSIFSSIVGFGFIVGVVCVMIGRRARSWRAVAPDLAALAIALMVLLAMSSGVWGVLQRVMFVTAACWYGRESWYVVPSPKNIR